MKDKQWIAKNIICGHIRLIRHPVTIEEGGQAQDVLTIERAYNFVDVDNKNIGALVPQRLVKNLSWNNVPAELKTVFNKLDTWTRNQALKEQGMV